MVEGDDIHIKNARIAIASKDLSYVKIRNIKVSNSKVGFAVFQKKPEYGYSNLEMINLKADDVDEPYLVEIGSTLAIEGEKVIPNSSHVRDLLYGSKSKTVN